MASQEHILLSNEQYDRILQKLKLKEDISTITKSEDKAENNLIDKSLVATNGQTDNEDTNQAGVLHQELSETKMIDNVKNQESNNVQPIKYKSISKEQIKQKLKPPGKRDKSKRDASKHTKRVISQDKQKKWKRFKV